ncbi:MAG: hypothetical protein KC613_23655 [Myxococcales bacterium]|nr:hypothetical protein [Myxococcales bacterium]
MRRRGFFAGALLAAGLGWSGCGELNNAEGPCDHGGDCVWPAVCCTEPRIPAFGQKIPFCESISYCDGYLPPMLEGNPCTGSGLGACAEPWACCPKTFTCLTAEACEATPAPEPTVSSNAACHAYSDCGAGEYCAGISLIDKDGVCTAFDPLPPPPDAGAP